MQQPPSQTPGGAGSELRSDAQRLSDSAADRLHSEVNARKETASDQAKSLSSAIGRAADGLDEGAPAWLKSSFRKGAEQIQRFADTLEQKDSRQLVAEVETFARERTGTFLLGCAAAGFAAARVLKAGGEREKDAPGRTGSDSSAGGDPSVGSSPSGARFQTDPAGEFA